LCEFFQAFIIGPPSITNSEHVVFVRVPIDSVLGDPYPPCVLIHFHEVVTHGFLQAIKNPPQRVRLNVMVLYLMRLKVKINDLPSSSTYAALKGSQLPLEPAIALALNEM
jgi:hypothetical protein